jgi:lipase chaperone LimK
VRRGLLAAGAIVVALAAAVAWWGEDRRPDGEAGESVAPLASRSSRSADARASLPAVLAPPGSAPDSTGPALPRRPASLRGSAVDGGLVVDADGRFVPTPDALRLFDYFLSASGEEPLGVLVARIRVEIDRRLPPDAAPDAHRLLDRYLEYRERVRALAEAGPAGDLDDRIAELHEIRVEIFGEETASALFAREESVDAVAVDRLELSSREDLSPAEREQRLADLEADLPPAERARRREARVALDLRRVETEALANGASSADLQALRESAVGADAAERLAALDRSRAEWRGRLDSFREARAAIEADASLDEAARARAIASLRAESFTEPELLRVDALDQIEGR